MHKDLMDNRRKVVEWQAGNWALALHEGGQSLALAREAWINAFDATAKELDAALPVS